MVSPISLRGRPPGEVQGRSHKMPPRLDPAFGGEKKGHEAGMPSSGHNETELKCSTAEVEEEEVEEE